jgi:hypothetical protein
MMPPAGSMLPSGEDRPQPAPSSATRGHPPGQPSLRQRMLADFWPDMRLPPPDQTVTLTLPDLRIPLILADTPPVPVQTRPGRFLAQPPS